MSHLVVTAALVLATIASTAMCLRSMNRTPKSKSGWPEDEWARGRLRGFYRGAVWGLVGAATGLALVVMQPKQHGGDHARLLESADHRWSAACATFWNPHPLQLSELHRFGR